MVRCAASVVSCRAGNGRLNPPSRAPSRNLPKPACRNVCLKPWSRILWEMNGLATSAATARPLRLVNTRLRAGLKQWKRPGYRRRNGAGPGVAMFVPPPKSRPSNAHGNRPWPRGSRRFPRRATGGRSAMPKDTKSVGTAPSDTLIPPTVASLSQRCCPQPRCTTAWRRFPGRSSAPSA